MMELVSKALAQREAEKRQAEGEPLPGGEQIIREGAEATHGQTGKK